MSEKQGIKRLLDVYHPIFLPAWRRAALCTFCVGWTAFELVNGNLIWAVVFGLIAAYLIWAFFLTFDPKDFERDS